MYATSRLYTLTQNIALFVLYRPFFYTAISDYTAKVFGYATFGTVYGTLVSIAGVCNILQFAFDSMTQNVFDGDPLPVNLFLLCTALLVGLFLVGYVFAQARHILRLRLEEEAEDAEELHMPMQRT